MPDPVKAPPAEVVEQEQTKIIDSMLARYGEASIDSLMIAELIGKLAYANAIINFNLGESR